MEQQSAAPPEVVNVIKFLRSSKAGIKTRTGILNGKRADYFKGTAAVKAVMSPAYAKLKNVPPQPQHEEQAVALLHNIIPFAFFLRAERGPRTGGAKSPKAIQIVQMQAFSPDFHFVWLWEGSQWTTYAGGVLMIAMILAGVMFPLWPNSMRVGVWYLSMGVLGLIGLFFAIAIVRLIFYIITIIVASPGIWIFPKLFADVGFVESFIPLWEWDLPPKKKGRKNKDKASKKEKANGVNGNGVHDVSNGSTISANTAPGLTSRSATGGPFIEEIADEGD
jgi:translocation protein SEC62